MPNVIKKKIKKKIGSQSRLNPKMSILKKRTRQMISLRMTLIAVFFRDQFAQNISLMIANQIIIALLLFVVFFIIVLLRYYSVMVFLDWCLNYWFFERWFRGGGARDRLFQSRSTWYESKIKPFVQKAPKCSLKCPCSSFQIINLQLYRSKTLAILINKFIGANRGTRVRS